MAHVSEAGEEQGTAVLLAGAVANGLSVLGSWDRQRFLVAFDRRVAEVLRDSRSTGGDIPPELEAAVTQLMGSIHFQLARRMSERLEVSVATGGRDPLPVPGDRHVRRAE